MRQLSDRARLRQLADQARLRWRHHRPLDPNARLGRTRLARPPAPRPDPTYYTLDVVPGTPLPGAPLSVEVRRPGLAGYLDRSDVVLKSADYTLAVNSQIRWAEPLGDMNRPCPLARRGTAPARQQRLHPIGRHLR